MQQRSTRLNWAELGYEAHDLEHLEAPFGLEELRTAVFSLPAEKAPGLDGFIGHFFRACWMIVDDDLLAAIMHMAEHGGMTTGLMNYASIRYCQKDEHEDHPRLLAD